MAFNDFIERELPKRPFSESDGLAGQVPVRSSNPLAAREMVWVDASTLVAAGADAVNKIEMPAESALSGHRVICSNGANQARYASSDTLSVANAVLGISLNAALISAPVAIQFAGTLIEPSWAWTPNMPVYCGIDGVLTQTPPSAGFVLVVGVAIAATALAISIKQPIVTV